MDQQIRVRIAFNNNDDDYDDDNDVDDDVYDDDYDDDVEVDSNNEDSLKSNDDEDLLITDISPLHNTIK